jgi:hypothetical protein
LKQRNEGIGLNLKKCQNFLIEPTTIIEGMPIPQATQANELQLK